ncbi:MAG: helix-hairpin-helix domain-containing protein [Janibacter sp.]
MSRRDTEPSERVEEILDGDRDRRVLELPSTVAQGRYAVSRQAVIGVVLVVAVAVAMLGGRYVLARGEAAPEPVGVTQPSDEAPGDEPSAPKASGTTAPGAAAATSSPTEVTVHVVGQVRRPGIVTLPAGARVAEALDEAGGESSSADLTRVNLARPLVDGEQVVVPKPGESPTPAGPAATAAGGGAAPAPGAAPGGSGQVNLNTADLATLETLPGVGPVLGQRILDWRTEHGQFTAVEELGEVSGVGDKTYAQLAPKVTV